MEHRRPPKTISDRLPFLGIAPTHMWLATLALGAVQSPSRGALLAEEAPRSCTVYSAPFDLRYGEVYNAIQPESPLPADVHAYYADGSKGAMAVTGYELDIVRRDADGRETSVPLYEVYVHHFKLNLGGERVAGGGGEYRRMVTPEQPAVLRGFGGAKPVTWSIEMHAINTHVPHATPADYDGRPSKLRECPCTPQRVKDLAAGTIDGVRPEFAHGASFDEHCDDVFAAALKASHNPTCSLASYVGGMHCAAHGALLLDTAQCERPGCAEHPRERFLFKATFHYEDRHGPREPPLLPIPLGIGEEYDVPRGEAGEHSEHVMSAVNPLLLEPDDWGEAGVVELTSALPHVHTFAVSLELQDAASNRSLCKVSRDNGGIVYGAGRDAGDEAGFVVYLRRCTWASGDRAAPRLRRGQHVRLIAVHNASEYRMGVMANWLLHVRPVDDV